MFTNRGHKNWKKYYSKCHLLEKICNLVWMNFFSNNNLFIWHFLLNWFHCKFFFTKQLDLLEPIVKVIIWLSFSKYFIFKLSHFFHFLFQMDGVCNLCCCEAQTLKGAAGRPHWVSEKCKTFFNFFFSVFLLYKKVLYNVSLLSNCL
jgi:hypothetical protein